MARRQRLSRAHGLAIAERHAWAHFGRKHYRLFIFGPFVWRAVMLGTVAVGLAVLWLRVPHAALGIAAIVAAVVVAAGWFVWTGSHAALQRRMSSRATGTTRGQGLGWAVACLVVLLSVTAWLSLGSPYA